MASGGVFRFMIDKRYSPKHKRAMWGFDEYIDDGRGKKRLRIYQFETRKQAEEVLSGLRAEERKVKFGLAPLINRPLLEDLITARIPTLAEKAERAKATRVLSLWLTLLDPKIKIDEIDTPQIRLYIKKRQEDERASATINRELTIIGATLHQAGEFFPELKQWKCPKIPRVKEGKSRREKIISDDEYSRLTAYLRRPPENLTHNERSAYIARVRVSQILEFAMMSAARHGEIVKLKWSDVDWERRKILIFQRKTGEHKEIPLTRSLIALLEERKPATGRFVFTGGGNIYPRFYEILKAACVALEIPYGRDLEDGLILHSARHTVTTRLVEAGLDFDTIGLITGHKTKELIAHYSHKHPGSVARAAEALERISKTGKV